MSTGMEKHVWGRYSAACLRSDATNANLLGCHAEIGNPHTQRVPCDLPMDAYKVTRYKARSILHRYDGHGPAVYLLLKICSASITPHPLIRENTRQHLANSPLILAARKS